MLTLSLFGGAYLGGGETPLTGRIVQRRRLALLALLASSRDRPVSRDKLIAYLWPESGATSARHSLSDSVHVIRKAVGEEAILAERDDLRLDPAALTCDVWDFEAALEAGDLERAVGLYAGPFLDGFFIGRDSLEFESWAASERDRLARAYMGALERLARGAVAEGTPERAAEWWRRLCSEAPDNSRAVLGLMEALAGAGDRAGALQQAHEHAEHLKSEYGAEPDPTVSALARRLQEEPKAWLPAAAASDRDLPATIETDPRRARVKGSERSLARVAAYVVLLLVLLVLPVLVIQRRDTTQADPGNPSPVAPGIAIVPFNIAGPDLEVWREGMVDLLSTNLDGLGGLRAINSRTILARWHEQVQETETADLAKTLWIARDVGARYVLVGSAVAMGRDVRLTAQIYVVDDGTNLGAGVVKGPPDSVLALVDQLTVEVLRAVLQAGDEDIPPVRRLESLTTASLPAMTAYLEGEALYRRSMFEEAIVYYERAIAADSTFALALHRLANAYGWMENVDSAVARGYLERAARLSGRLPARQAVLVRADYALHQGMLDGIEPLREVVRNYPDDPDAWYLLGDTYVHIGQQALVAESEIDNALSQAVKLSPDFGPYYIHIIERAVRKGERSRASALIERYGGLAAGSTTDRRNRLAFMLAFGDSVARAGAWAALDTIPSRVLWGAAGLYLSDPSQLETQERILRAARSRSDAGPAAANFLFFNLLNRGRFLSAKAQLEDPQFAPGLRAYGVYTLFNEGMALPPRWLEAELTLSTPDTVPEVVSFYAGAYAADQGRWSDYAAAVQQQRRHARQFWTMGDTVGSRFHEASALALHGYKLRLDGRRSEALQILQTAQKRATGPGPRNRVNATIRLWIAELLTEAGRPREATRLYATFWDDAFALYRMGEIYAGLGEAEKARQAYSYALRVWQGADTELLTRISAARHTLEELTSDPPDTRPPARVSGFMPS